MTRKQLMMSWYEAARHILEEGETIKRRATIEAVEFIDRRDLIVLAAESHRRQQLEEEAAASMLQFIATTYETANVSLPIQRGEIASRLALVEACATDFGHGVWLSEAFNVYRTLFTTAYVTSSFEITIMRHWQE